MVKITEKIDLTLNSLFAGDEDIRLMPEAWRRHQGRNSSVFIDLRKIMERVIRRNCPGLLEFDFFRESEINWTFFYFILFREFPRSAYEETMDYGNPNICQMCGGEVNVLTKNEAYDSCDNCYKLDSLKGGIAL